MRTYTTDKQVIINWRPRTLSRNTKPIAQQLEYYCSWVLWWSFFATIFKPLSRTRKAKILAKLIGYFATLYIFSPRVHRYLRIGTWWLHVPLVGKIDLEKAIAAFVLSNVPPLSK